MVRLQPGRERSLQQHHPWIFSGAVASVTGEPGSGHTVVVLADDGTFLCRAAYSPESQIRTRAWSFDPDESIDAGFFERRIATAIEARRHMLDTRHTACRLVHGESDGLPGIVVDRYDNALVLQLTSAGADHWRDTIIATLVRQVQPDGVYERSDAEVRALEGLVPRTGVAFGHTPGVVEMLEDGLRYRVDIAAGQKTGFFLDQRDNRRTIRACAAGRDTLNMFCYTGAFSLAALAGGARSVLSVDSSADALGVAAGNLARNPELPQGIADWREADAFSELRRLRDKGASFELVVLDPPKFAPTAQHAEGAARAYKDINLLALKLLRPGGLLATFSCSGGIDAGLFRKIVAGAALDARVTAVVERTFGASADHAVSLTFPEGEYLKGLLVRRAAS
ncbi:MAG: class I SAM-dependent rRNA methyltransferase [Casimicrobiaceae bacterium]